MRNYSIHIREEYLSWVLKGSKTIEVRVAYPRLSRMTAGDTITFNGEHTYRVARVNRYPSFDALLKGEDPERIAPEITQPGALMSALRAIYPPEKEALGVLAIHLVPLSTSSPDHALARS